MIRVAAWKRQLELGVVGFLALLGWTSSGVAAPLNYNGGYYLQDFNGLPTNVTNAAQALPSKEPTDFMGNITGASGLEGWQLANPLGSGSSTEFKSQDGSAGSSAGRGVISFGTNGSSDRALGGLSTSNQIGRFGLVLTNNTTTTFTKFSIEFTGEIWRRGNIPYPPLEGGMNDLLVFEYGKGASIAETTSGGHFPLSFAGPMASGYAALPPTEMAVNGNDPIYRARLGERISGINWVPGETFVLSWQAVDFSGQDDGLAIDDLSLIALPDGVSTLKGDFNQDHLLSHRDVQALLDAVNDLDAYKTAYGVTQSELETYGDLNGSGTVNDADILPLLKLLAGAGPAALTVPEPASFVLGVFSLLGLVSLRKRG